MFMSDDIDLKSPPSVLRMSARKHEKHVDILNTGGVDFAEGFTQGFVCHGPIPIPIYSKATSYLYH